MNGLKNTMAAAIAGSTLFGGVALAQNTVELTEEEQNTVEHVQHVRSCTQQAINKVTNEDIDRKVSALKEEFQSQLDGYREELKQENPGVSDSDINDHIDSALEEDAKNIIFGETLAACSEEINVSWEDLAEKAEALAGKYGQGVFAPQSP